MDCPSHGRRLDDQFQGSVVVGEHGSSDGLAGAVVVPDRCGHGQQALKDAHEDPTWGVSTVLFQIELSLKCVEDRLDALAERFEEPAAGSFGFALASTAQQLDAALASNSRPK